MPLFTDAVANLRRTRRSAGQLGAMTPIISSGSVNLVDSLIVSYATIYRSQPWVWAATNKLARQLARIPLKAFERDEGDRRRLYEGSLADILHRPYTVSRGIKGTPFRYKERTAKNVIIYGNAISVKLGTESEDDPPTEIMPAPAVGWSVGENDTYVWTSKTGERYPFERWQIIHYSFWDLDENGFGISMLEPLRQTLAIDDAARRLGVATFQHGNRPAGVLKTDQQLTEPVIARIKEQLRATHGSVDKAFKLAILEQGLDWVPMSHNLNDSAVVDHRKLTREEVAAVFDVPQPTIGILDEANFASVDQLHTMLYQDSLGPWCKMIEETTQAELIDPVPEWDGQFVEFDLNAVLRGDIATRYRAYATAISNGFKTPDEIRQLENDPPMADKQPEAGRLLFPLNMSGAVAAQLSEDQGDEDA